MLFVNKVTFGKSLGHLEMGLVARGTNLVISESEVAQSCPALYNPMDCSLRGSSIHGMFQARVLDGLPFPSPGDLPDPGIEPGSSPDFY